MERRAPIVQALVASFGVALAVSTAPVTPQEQSAVRVNSVPSTAAEAEREFTTLLQRYVEAYARKDLDGMAALWHPKGPARYGRNVFAYEFELRDTVLSGLTLREVAVDAAGGRARAIIDLRVTDAKTHRTRAERRVRDFTFLRDDTGTWTIWNEASPALQLARRLLDAPPDRRWSLIEAEPELASDDALTGLGVEAAQVGGAGQFADRLAILELQARLARQIGHDAVLGGSLVQAGLVLQIEGRFDDAARAFSEARDAFQRIGNEGEAAAGDANLGAVAYLKGQFAEAADLYRRASDTFERLHDDPRTASSLHGWGNTLYMQGEFAFALERYERAASIFDRLHDNGGLVGVLQAIALVHKELGDYPPAADAWQRSVQLAVSAKDPAAIARAWSGLSDTYRLEGDLARALEYQLQAVRVLEATPDLPNLGTAYFQAGRIAASQRDFAGAVAWCQKALDTDRRIALDTDTANAAQARDLAALGGANLSRGQADVALPQYKQSLALREAARGPAHDELAIAWTLVHLGILHQSQQRFDEALTCYGRALAMAKRLDDPNAVSTTLALRSQVELLQGQTDAALSTATEAADIAAAIEHFDTLAYARVVEGKAHQAAQHPGPAQTAIEAAVSALRQVPVGPAAETFFDDRRGPYVAMVDLLVSQGRNEEAFVWSERGRLRALADMLGGDGAMVSKGLTPSEREEELRQLRAIRTLSVRIARERARPHPDAMRLASLQDELTAARSGRDALRRQFFENHPSLAVLRAQREPLGIDEAGDALGAATALLSYMVGDTRTVVFALGRDEVTGRWALQQTAVVEVKAFDLTQQVRNFRDAIRRRDDRALEIARDLHAKLVAPVEGVLANKSAVRVVPDGVLWSLPFEALVAPTGRFLVERVAVAYAPSLTSLVAATGAAPDEGRQWPLVAVGNPLISKVAADRLARIRAGSATISSPDDFDLPRIVALVGPARSTTWLGPQATGDRLVRGLPACTVLHLGVPIVLTEASPFYTTLAMSPRDATDTSNGLIEAATVMEWDLRTGAVVAPRVEFGPISNGGDALVALSWSLLVAGSPTLVTLRWATSAQAPSVVTRFYRAFLQPPLPSRTGGPGPSASLQRAMVSILAQPATRHPFYWAGAMVIGRN